MSSNRRSPSLPWWALPLGLVVLVLLSFLTISGPWAAWAFLLPVFAIGFAISARTWLTRGDTSTAGPGREVTDEPLRFASAIEDPTVSAPLRGYRLRSWTLLATGVVLWTVMLVLVSTAQSRADALQDDGVHVHGTVEQAVGRHDRGHLIVDFDYRGQPRTARIELDNTSPDYQVDQPVTVLVDPHDDHHVTLVGEDNESDRDGALFIATLIGGGLLLGLGSFGVVRAARQRRLLSRYPWRRFSAEHDNRRSTPRLTLVDGDERWRVRPAWTTTWRLGRSGLRDAPLIDAAGDPGGRMVLRSVGSTVLLSARGSPSS